MFRPVLAWVLISTFLATAPVTGAGLCPCQFLPELTCECTDGEHVGGAEWAPERADGAPVLGVDEGHDEHGGSCDHCLTAAAVAAAGAGDRAALARDDVGACAICLAAPARSRPVSGSLAAGPPYFPRPSAHLIRYAHAFRS